MEFTHKSIRKDFHEGYWKYADEFKSWLTEVQKSEFDYVVAVTRRGPNIIELLLQTTEDLAAIGKQLITDNGLLTQAERIAEEYLKNDVFPTIVVLDDLLVHGRSLDRFLTTFQTLLFECARQLDDTLDEQKFEESFYKCITVWIFAINDAPFCLKQEYQWRLRYQNIWTESQWRELSSSIANFIWTENIANTSYVLSARMQESSQYPICQQESHSWICNDSVRYRNGDQTFYLLKDACAYNIFPTVRSYTRKECRYFTPYFFVNRLKPDQVVLALRKVIQFIAEMDGDLSKTLTRLFNRIGKHHSRLSVYCQLFYLLLSQITLRVFLEENFIIGTGNILTRDLLQSDARKIGRNFGCVEENESLLNNLYQLPWTKEQLLVVIRLLSHENALINSAQSKEGIWTSDGIIEVLENKVYTQALTHEEKASDFYGGFASNLYGSSALDTATGEKAIDDILDEVRAELQISPTDIDATVVILSYITQMMDRGDISLKARAELQNGELMFYSAVRNTEMSLSIFPRRISPVFPKFYRMAQFYWRDDDFPERVKAYFETNNIIEDLTSEARNCAKDAVQFAELICKHRSIADSMLNWKSVYGRSNFM